MVEADWRVESTRFHRLFAHARSLEEEVLLSVERLATVAFTPPCAGGSEERSRHLHGEAQDAHRSQCAQVRKPSHVAATSLCDVLESLQELPDATPHKDALLHEVYQTHCAVVKAFLRGRGESFEKIYRDVLPSPPAPLPKLRERGVSEPHPLPLSRRCGRGVLMLPLPLWEGGWGVR